MFTKTLLRPTLSSWFSPREWGGLSWRVSEEELTQAASWLQTVPRPLLFLLALGCIGLGALMAGLTLGLMSLDLFQLELLAVSGVSLEEKAAAQAIAPLRAKGNQLLVTLLLTNTLANELLPLVLDTLFPGGYAALVISVVSVVIFGEVLPQAVSSRYGLKVGAATVGFTRTLMAIFWPIAAPAAWLLDKMLGKELRTGYDRDRLKALIQLHGPAGTTVPTDLESAQTTNPWDELSSLHSQARHANYAATAATTPDFRQRSDTATNQVDDRVHQTGPRKESGTPPLVGERSRSEQKRPPDEGNRTGFSVLSADEASMLVGILELSSKTVRQVMTKADDVFCLSVDDCLDRQMLKRILRLGHSRVPIYDGCRDNIIAILLVKQLLLVDPNKALPIRAIIRRKKRSHKKKVVSPVYVSQDCNLLDLLNEFQVGRSHMAIVVDSLEHPADQAPRRFLGIVTLEDIVEEMIKEEVLDETDVFVDNEHRRPVLIRGQDNKWHYSIPPELLANRRRNPRFIQYRDIDESAYAEVAATSRACSASSEQRFIQPTTFTRSVGAIAPSTTSKKGIRLMNADTLHSIPELVPKDDTGRDTRTGTSTTSSQLTETASFASGYGGTNRSSPRLTSVEKPVSQLAPDASHAQYETPTPSLDSRERTCDSGQQVDLPVVTETALSVSDSDESIDAEDDHRVHHFSEGDEAEADKESASEAETDLEYDFEVGTYVDPKKLPAIPELNADARMTSEGIAQAEKGHPTQHH
ncbi:hypothetical protein F1559_001728 [Cyanidiococcus yangmingshanensis]|uniref:Metal transporter cnnm2 n=1 Tax=Cyanidiococcus yangmingshanensis TaxID=2690220 RepID=A0A7J7IFS7_9RHOD|nr:hypothetical protein F1559_001728 [Cyanidiococcus yangmingshanensis]